MASDSFVQDLRNARGLAQQLWGATRESGSSYALLSGSIRNLRNVLEELEELEILEEPDIKLQIARSREVLERLDLSFQSYRCSKNKDVNESAVADFKTGLDVIGQKLTAAHDAMCTGEIPLKLDTSAIPALASPSSRWGSTSASAVESGHERRPSSQTSSVYSLIAQENPWKQTNPDSPSFEADSDQERQPEKEVYNLGVAYLQNSTSESALTAITPSLDWRSPFASPDPMSISIEQASTMILREDVALTPSPARSRSIKSPRPSSNAHAQASARQSEPQVAAGLGIMTGEQETHETNAQPKRTGQATMRPRAASESAQPLRQRSRSGTSDPTSPKLHATKSNESDDRAPFRRPSSVRNDAGHLSPNAISQGLGRRGRTNSGASITFSTRSVETGEPTTDYDLESKELSVVIETGMSETDEAISTTPQPQPASLDNSAPPTTPAAEVKTPPPPPPTRRPPSPPKQRRVPKIPKRASTYKIVNVSLSDESPSDEDDSYSSSKPSSAIDSKQPLESQAEEGQSQGVYVEGSAYEESAGQSPEARHARRSGRERVTHAQRVLMARAAYAPPTSSQFAEPGESHNFTKMPAFAAKLSLQNLSSRRRSEENPPPLKRHSTSVVPSRDRPSKFEESAAPKAAIIPERAESRNYGRPMSASGRPEPSTTQSTPAAIPQDSQATAAEKELAPEIGLEVNDMPELKSRKSRRISVDAALNVRGTPDTIQVPNAVRDAGSSSGSASISHGDAPSTAESGHGLTGWYAPGNEIADITDLDAEHIQHVMHFFNKCAWDQAESYLTGYLESLIEQDKLDRARRVRHLLGVCASFKGQWTKAIPLFLSVLRAPISDVAEIDEGDCAAAYWLGDTYSLLNQRTEALLAYCIAERCSLFLDGPEHGINDCINAEQEAVRLGASEADFKLRWSQEMFDSESPGLDSILDTKVITTSAAHTLVENEPRRARRGTNSSGHDSLFQLDQNKSRSLSLFSLNKRSQYSKYHRVKITPTDFEPDTSWPMMYDPFFSMANVRRGRLLVYECDLLAVLGSNVDAKIPKSGPMSLNRIDCFTSPDLNWLIQTIRECLRMLEMEWSEVANVEGTWFVVRYSFMKGNFATTHYFSIAVFRQAFKLRSGYGVEICSDGICSARIVQSDLEHLKGVHTSEGKRVKKLIREYLDSAAKQQAKAK